MRRLAFFLALSCISAISLANSFVSSLVPLPTHPIHVVTWGDMNNVSKPTMILLSGPIDSWHSDSAWWASVGKQLAKTHRVIAIDRAGVATHNQSAPLGYLHFAKDLNSLISHFNISQATLLAFASSNITVMKYLSDYPDQQVVKRVVMIDPDVLTEFSIARYTSDTQPFKDNLEKYLEYIREGKYTPRVQQKNQMDKQTLTELSGDTNSVEWSLVAHMAKLRLDIVHQQNFFKEIAMYGEELNQVKDISWPASVALLLFDSAFEAAYAKKTEDQEAKQGLLAWQQDGERYYRHLVSQSDQGQYVLLDNEAHLYQFAETEKFIKTVVDFSLLP